MFSCANTASSTCAVMSFRVQCEECALFRHCARVLYPMTIMLCDLYSFFSYCHVSLPLCLTAGVFRSSTHNTRACPVLFELGPLPFHVAIFSHARAHYASTLWPTVGDDVSVGVRSVDYLLLDAEVPRGPWGRKCSRSLFIFLSVVTLYRYGSYRTVSYVQGWTIFSHFFIEFLYSKTSS